MPQVIQYTNRLLLLVCLFVDPFQPQGGSSNVQHDRVVFLIGIQGETLMEGYYAGTGTPISFTYEEAPNLEVTLSLGNLGPRPIRLQPAEGGSWLDHVKFEIYRDEGDLAQLAARSSWSDYPVKLIANTMRVKERIMSKTNYLKNGIPITPSEYVLESISKIYRPHPELYDDFKRVREPVEEFPPTLDLESYAEVICEFTDESGQRLPVGAYWVRATLDLTSLQLRLPSSHLKTWPSSYGPVEIRQIKTPDDRVNYHMIRSRHFLREKNLVAAEEELRNATTIVPDSIRAWLNLGRFYEGHDQYDQAITAYTKAKELTEKKGLPIKAEITSDQAPVPFKEVNGRLLFEEPAYTRGMIERVQQKKLEKGRP